MPVPYRPSCEKCGERLTEVEAKKFPNYVGAVCTRCSATCCDCDCPVKSGSRCAACESEQIAERG